MTAQPSFIFGGDTGVQTPEELARLRAIADALARPAAPRTVGQGLNAIGEAIGYRLADKKATGAERDWRKGGDGVFSALFGNASPASAPATSSAVASALGGGSMGSPPDLSGNDIYNGFIDTVKTKVTNPNGLAAVASTANAESRFNPKNAFGSWSDPSERGQAGTAGGILSWRGPRFEAMRSFAGNNGGDASAPSPQLQAQYFLNEDPALIDALNAAKSPEEAQRLMNNAWKFAGYDRPGGEAARRISMANSFATRFTGSDAPVTVASTDPSAGVAQALDRQPAPSAAPQSTAAQALARQSPRAAEPPPSPRQATGPQGLPANAPMGTIAKGADGQTYQYAETTGMAGASGPSGWIRANPDALQGGQAPVKVAGGPNLQQLMQASQDPRLSQEQRGVVNLMLKQKLDEASPAMQLELEKNRLDMEKTRIETERLRNPQMTPAEKARLEFDERKLQADHDKLIEVGGSLIDPNTHQPVYTGQQTDWEKLDDGTLYNKRTGETKAVGNSAAGGEGNMFKGNAVDAQALNWLINNNKVTREQAAQIAAGKTITGPNGEMLFLTVDGIVSQMPGQKPQPLAIPQQAAPAQQAPQAAPQPSGAPPVAVPGPAQAPNVPAPAAPAPVSPRAANPPPSSNAGIVPLTGPKVKPPNEQQQRDNKLYSVVAPQLQIVKDNFDDLSNLSDQALSAIPHGSDYGADYLKSPGYQRATNAINTIIASYLYSVSGATASPQEVEKLATGLIPKPGEAKASIDDKFARLQQYVEAIKTGGSGEQPTPGDRTTSGGLKWSIEP